MGKQPAAMFLLQAPPKAGRSSRREREAGAASGAKLTCWIHVQACGSWSTEGRGLNQPPTSLCPPSLRGLLYYAPFATSTHPFLVPPYAYTLGLSVATVPNRPNPRGGHQINDGLVRFRQNQPAGREQLALLEIPVSNRAARTSAPSRVATDTPFSYATPPAIPLAHKSHRLPAGLAKRRYRMIRPSLGFARSYSMSSTRR